MQHALNVATENVAYAMSELLERGMINLHAISISRILRIPAIDLQVHSPFLRFTLGVEAFLISWTTQRRDGNECPYDR